MSELDTKAFFATAKATRIKETIIDLTDNLKTEEELWNAFKVIKSGLHYLSAKHTMEEVKNQKE